MVGHLGMVGKLARMPGFLCLRWRSATPPRWRGYSVAWKTDDGAGQSWSGKWADKPGFDFAQFAGRSEQYPTGQVRIRLHPGPTRQRSSEMHVDRVFAKVPAPVSSPPVPKLATNLVVLDGDFRDGDFARGKGISIRNPPKVGGSKLRADGVELTEHNSHPFEPSPCLFRFDLQSSARPLFSAH